MIGAGAAGMMCAAQAGQRGRRVLLIEHYHTLGEKIRISGGGRCNFTNIGASPADYLSQNPDFCRSALARYTPRDFVALVERHGIAYHEKKLGQLFCDDKAQDIIAHAEGGVRPRARRLADALRGRGRRARRRRASSSTTAEGTVRAGSLVIATGGLTVPKIGATPFGYQIAEQFGLDVVPPRPALVPLAFAPDALARYGDLAGHRVDVEVSCNGGRFRENLLFTHRGLSGPAILQISSYWDGEGAACRSTSCPDAEARRVVSRASARRRRSSTMCWRNACRGASRQHGAPRTTQRARWRHRSDRALRAQSRARCIDGASAAAARSATTRPKSRWAASIRASSRRRRWRATRVPGLYFIGEVVDVTGWLGGYNFQWAWASGHAAAAFV